MILKGFFLEEADRRTERRSINGLDVALAGWLAGWHRRRLNEVIASELHTAVYENCLITRSGCDYNNCCMFHECGICGPSHLV